MEFNDYKVFNKEKGSRNIIVKGASQDVCTYQITYNSLDNSLVSVIKNVPYEIIIDQASDIAYYLYYHRDNFSFSIVMMIDSGNGNLYAMPFKNKNGNNTNNPKI